MRGRSRRREGGAENNSNGKGNICFGEHCRISSRQLGDYAREDCKAGQLFPVLRGRRGCRIHVFMNEAKGAAPQ